MSKIDTIHIAVDLGTTNSTVAVNRNGKIEIIKNTFGDSSTPSVFGIDKSENLVVGKRAYEKLFRDASANEVQNYKAEVKRIMGTKEKILFPRINKEMNPEEISSEILKSLKADVLRKYPNFPTLGVVVTVPAHFSTVQAEATKRACNLAGFEHAILLQEPIAAAMSYRFGLDKNHNWLVYDLGGGTFDVAVISSKDGILSCVSHCGDNFLGGKDIDWMIVDNILVTQLKKEYNLTDFDRGNPKHQWKFSKLKYFAENAKIYLTEYEKTSIELNGLGNDNEDKEISSLVKFSRGEFNKLIDPLIKRTIELSKKVIVDSGLNSKSIEKIVLVGGPTQIPFLRDTLYKALNIEVDTSSDPLTAVAHGACIFAVSQKIPDDIVNANYTNEDDTSFEITLNYERMTSDSEEAVSGIIKLNEDNLDEYYIQIQSDDGTFSTPKIPLKNGRFYQSVTIQEKKLNLFWIYLLDSNGNTITLTKDSFTITHGLTVGGAPLPHSIGVGIIKKMFSSKTQIVETIDSFFEMNSTLPLTETKTYKTVRKLSKGDISNALPIKVFEGESNIPDRNQIICQLQITGEHLPHDLPEGTDVDITINVDVSRTVTVEAFLPTIDLRIDARATVYAEDVSMEEIEKDLASQEERMISLSKTVSQKEENKFNTQIQQARDALKNSDVDEDEKRKASNIVRDLKTCIDNSEKDKAFPALKIEFDELIKKINNIFEMISDSEENKTFKLEYEQIKKDGQAAISNEDKTLLARVNEQIVALSVKISTEDPFFLANLLAQLSEGEHNYIDKKEAEYFMKKGKKAVEFNDVEELKRCVKNLYLLLPPTEQALSSTALSGITK